jgi:SagB-type dehydrogenase family enzyme
MIVVEQQTVQLPAPRYKGTVSIEAALAARRSRRAYTSEPVKLAELGQLLWAAQGITGPEGQRTAPSAGAIHPLEVYVSASRVEGLAPGIYKYCPEHHSLTVNAAGDKRKNLAAAAGDQDCVRFSACALIIAADYEPTSAKYGDRATRYVHIEVGQVSENVYLQATALGLGVCIVGSFEPAGIGRIALVPKEEKPVCMLMVGRLG